MQELSFNISVSDTLNEEKAFAQTQEHVIGYAYPSSDLSRQLGHSKSGCFYVESADKTMPAATYLIAKSIASGLGTSPGRWSMDHQSNSHLR